MKILIVNDQFENGGAGRVTVTMCCELARRGYDLEIVTDNINFLVRYSLPDSVKIHPVSFIGTKKGTLSRVKSLFKTASQIRPVIKQVKPDLIIAIQSNGYIRTFIANRFMGIPVIAVDHTSFERKMDLINTFTRHYLYKFADGLSILTKRDEKLLGSKYPQKRVIYNPLPYPLIQEEAAREKTVLCVGRFDIWQIKGFDLIVDMWDKLAPAHPEWKLVFAGTGNDENVNYIKGLVHERKLDDSVRFLGQVNDMKKLYTHSGIFALSSRIEGFPMVLLEAMSQGCPCVAFNVGGASEEMIDQGAGFVIEDSNLDAFQLALAELMDDDEKRKQYSHNAVESVAKFSVSSFGDCWENMIDDTLRKKNR